MSVVNVNKIEARGIKIAKTITLRIDDETYELIKKAAAGERRSISNFIEYATVSYINEESFVSDKEMEEILRNDELLNSLSEAKKDIENGGFRIVE